ncbi:MAG: cell division protein FtsA [Verrucomicrobia bacterium]|nr:cell division protein FtsA [Verrucomicrobiota bacterium]
MSRPHYIVGLEIGTSKICTVVGELRDDGAVAVIGVGVCPSRGVRKAEIVDLDTAEQCVLQSAHAAEESAGVDIRGVYAGVSGAHVGSLNNRGVQPLLGDHNEVSEADVEAVLRHARTINIPNQDVILHALCRRYEVDGQDDVDNPVGMCGSRLQAEVHVIHAVRSRTENVIRCIRDLPPLEVNEVAFNGYAAAQAVLTEEEKELGALVIDMGGGTTDFVICARGAIRHSGVVAVGGDHITNDVSLGLKIPLSAAERLKVEYGSVSIEDTMKNETVSLSGEISIGATVIFKDHLCQIMRLRVEETLQLIKRELDKSGCAQLIGAGVFLTGGCAHVRGIQQLAESVLGLPVQIGTAKTVMGLTAALDRPEYATPIGIVRFGAVCEELERRNARRGGRIKLFFNGLLQSIRSKQS